MARLARSDHGGGRAARALGARAGGIEPEPEGDADGVGSGAQERHRAVDSAAHRHRDASRGGRGDEHRGDRIRKRIRGEGLARHRRRLEQREADERPHETRCIGLDDDVVLHDQPHGDVVLAARGVADEFEQTHAVRLAGGSTTGCRRIRALRVDRDLCHTE